VIRIGVLTPHAAIGPEEEFRAMAPGSVVARVVRVSDDAADGGARSEPPTTPRGLRALAAAPLLDNAARLLATDEVHVVGYASTTSAYVIGVEDETALVSRLAAQLEVPVAATCASAVLALRALGVERVALVGAPWFEPQLNELGGAYFRSQGFDVVSSASADLPHDRRRIEPASVFAWTSRHVPDDAGGVFIGGNGFRAARAIEPLETALGRPVLTSNQVLLWNLLALVGGRVEISGYGRLFARTSPDSAPRNRRSSSS
jgi:maleate isomerase